MGMRLTETLVAKLEPKDGKSVRISDTQAPGLILRISAAGAKSYAAQYYVAKKAKYFSLGRTPPLPLDEARRRANAFLLNPNAALKELQTETFGQVAENWWKREMLPRQLRTQRELRRMLDTYVLPKWRDLKIDGISKTEVTALEDKISDENGKRQSERVLGLVGQIMRWHEDRVEGYRAPVRKRRLSTKSQRDRVLSHDEIRLMWNCSTNLGMYGSFLKLALLTAQRREKLATMRWDEIVDGVWTLAVVPREKGHVQQVKLPALALQVIRSQGGQLDDNPYVFPGAGTDDRPFSGFSKLKTELHRRMRLQLPDMPTWTVHDLRRTARTLMSEARISSELAERVLGHKTGGVQGIYDRFAYTEEKSEALQTLAEHIVKIIQNRKPSHEKQKAREWA